MFLLMNALIAPFAATGPGLPGAETWNRFRNRQVPGDQTRVDWLGRPPAAERGPISAVVRGPSLPETEILASLWDAHWH